jgi:hypothetical protein
VSELSRRQVLQGGALSTAGLALLPAAALPAAHARASKAAARPVFGTDHTAWHDVSAAVGARLHGQRCYAPGRDGVPGRWFHTGGPVRMVVGSIKPDVHAVVSGKLDAQLHAFAAKVPRGSAATLWHEGEERNHGAHVPPATLVRMHARAAKIFRSEGAKYVQVVGGYSPIALGKALPHYICGEVDAVYNDGYQYHPGQGPAEVYGAVAEAITIAAGKHIPRGITETNTQFLGNRPRWFADAWRYVTTHHYHVFFTFWNSEPRYRWHSGDHATIGVLRRIHTASVA